MVFIVEEELVWEFEGCGLGPNHRTGPGAGGEEPCSQACARGHASMFVAACLPAPALVDRSQHFLTELTPTSGFPQHCAPGKQGQPDQLHQRGRMK